MPQTIAIFSANHVPNIGGIEWYTHNLAAALVEMGYRPIVVTNNVFGLPSQQTDENGADIVRLPCINCLKGRFPVGRKGAQRDRLMAWVAAQDVDYVSVNTRFYPHSLLGIGFAESRGIRPLVVDHGSAHLTLGSPVFDVGVRAVEHAFTEAVKRHDADYYAVSQAGVEWLTHFGITAKGVLNNSIDAAAFRASSSGRDFCAERAISPDSFIVSFTGRYIPEKGVLALAEAAQLLEGEGVEFFLAGDGPLRDTLERDAPRNLHLLGKIASSDVAALLLRSDAFCLPSRSEGFSSSLLEAAACGAVPVITRVGGVAELMPDDRYGMVLHEATGAAVAEALMHLRTHPDERQSMADAIQKRVESEFSWQRTAELTIEACRRANRR